MLRWPPANRSSPISTWTRSTRRSSCLRYPELRGKARRHRRRPAPSAGRIRRPADARRRAHVRDAARLRRTRRHHDRDVRSARARPAFGDGHDEGGALAPDAILLPVDFDAYRHYSRLFKAAVARSRRTIEDRGIDEIYIDLTDACAARLRTRPIAPRLRALAQSIKDAVRAATGLSCSIGIAPNKLLAKIASELDKPDGLTILGDGDRRARIWPLPARKINGIGPKSAARLEALGIRTIGELARADRGVPGRARSAERTAQWMHDAAHGRDERPVVTYSEPKSISRETTFERDLSATRDREQLSRDLHRALRRRRRRSAAQGLRGPNDRRQAALRQLRDGHARAHDRRADAGRDAIRRAAGECLKRVDLTRRIRLDRRARRRTRARGRHARGARA